MTLLLIAMRGDRMATAARKTRGMDEKLATLSGCARSSEALTREFDEIASVYGIGYRFSDTRRNQ
jgi:hypothetical protein